MDGRFEGSQLQRSDEERERARSGAKKVVYEISEIFNQLNTDEQILHRNAYSESFE